MEQKYGQPRNDIDTYPQLWADTLDIITVGAVDALGNRAPFSQGGPLLTVSTQGVNVWVDVRTGVGRVSGTSVAAAAISGLSAYLMSSQQYGPNIRSGAGSMSKKVKDLIVQLAYARVPGGPICAFNGAYWDTNPACQGRRRKRDGGCGEHFSVMNVSAELTGGTCVKI